MDPLLGMIILFGGNFAPSGWAFCDGRLLQIAQYNALYAILGTQYGGDGKTTFALPNLKPLATLTGQGQASYIIALVGIFPQRQ